MMKRYNNLFIYECGTRWQVSSHEHALPTGTSNVPATRASNPSQTDLWYQMAGSGSHERETAPPGYDGDAVKTGMQNVSMKTGTQNVATLRLTGLLIAVSGPPGMSPPGTKSSHLGMSRPEAASSVETRS